LAEPAAATNQEDSLSGNLESIGLRAASVVLADEVRLQAQRRAAACFLVQNAYETFSGESKRAQRMAEVGTQTFFRNEEQNQQEGGE